MENEKIIKRDENGKPIVGSYEYGTVDERQEALDKFKLQVLSTFEEELDALLSNIKNEDVVGTHFELVVYNTENYDNRYDANIFRRTDRTVTLVNPKTVEDLKPVEEESEDE